jgi:protein involved in polysaccharide export with SLBB domain
VRPDGRISLELLGDVQASGRTVEQLRSDLAERYAATLKFAEVVVIVKEVAPRRIYVGGEVNSPGLLRVPGSLTAMQAIFEAGGFKRSGQMKQIVILRYQGTPEPLFMTLNLEPGLKKKGGPPRDIALQPFDVVWVPKTGVAKLNDFVDQYFRQLVPIPMVLGLNYMFGGTTIVR